MHRKAMRHDTPVQPKPNPVPEAATDDILAGLGRAILTPHLGQPDDIADLVVFLASEESRYITGQMIPIDGGMSAHVGSAAQSE